MEFPIDSTLEFNTYKNQTIITVNDSKYLINTLDVNDLVLINNFFKKFKEYCYILSKSALEESILYKGCNEKYFYKVQAFNELKRWFSNLSAETRLYLALYDE